MLRPSYRTWLGGRFYLSAGLGNFFTFNKIIDNRWEIRPFQGLQFNWPQWKTPLNHYIRLEERFDFNLNTWNSQNSAQIHGHMGFKMSYDIKAHKDKKYSSLGVLYFLLTLRFEGVVPTRVCGVSRSQLSMF